MPPRHSGNRCASKFSLMDRLGATAKGSEKRLMAEHFILSSRYEYLFWEQAYRLESWPI